MTDVRTLFVHILFVRISESYPFVSLKNSDEIYKHDYGIMLEFNWIFNVALPLLSNVASSTTSRRVFDSYFSSCLFGELVLIEPAVCHTMQIKIFAVSLPKSHLHTMRE